MLFAVNRRWGPAWDRARPLREQQQWAAHAQFMDELVAEGFVVLGGPLGDGALLIVDAESQDAIHARFEADPWSPTEMLRTAFIEPWEILLGDPPRPRSAAGSEGA